MVTRNNIVEYVKGQNFAPENGQYDQPNPYSKNLGRPSEAWCGDFVTDVYKQCGLPLPIMQAGCHSGFAYVPDAVTYAKDKAAFRESWKAEPGDLCCFDWNNDNVADHVEIVLEWHNGTLITRGGNSEPNGGVNTHTWVCNENVGNPDILGVVNTGRIVEFAKPVEPTHSERLLQLKTPLMHGPDVAELQTALRADGYGLGPSGVDGKYGPYTRNAVWDVEVKHSLHPDGVAGKEVRKVLGIS